MFTVLDYATVRLVFPEGMPPACNCEPVDEDTARRNRIAWHDSFFKLHAIA